jgi:integrase
MATFRRRQDKWQVQVRRAGFPSVSKSFRKKADANSWARQIEAKADTNEMPPDPRQLANIRLSDLIKRYQREIAPLKKGGAIEQIVLGAVLRHWISSQTLAAMNASLFASYRDERLVLVRSSTVKRELAVLQHMLNVAQSEWGITMPNNPVELIQKPSACKPRKRRLEAGEFEALQDAVNGSRASYLWPLVELAIQTGMRRGEMLKAEWCDLDLQARKLTLYDTKNGEDRSIPLTNRATEILSALPRTDDRMFPVTPVAVRHSWERLRKRAGIKDLHFHDLRHEAISRFFEMGLSVPEVALISGHKDYRMLARYTHLRAEDVVGKLK